MGQVTEGYTKPYGARHRMRISEFLCMRLHEAGCQHMFGVPGDFNLGLLNRVIESPIEYVGCCNELNAAYAADGCARVSGLAACVTTYAVGELSAMNGIAGAYAESVPVVKIVGAPARKFYSSKALLHHTLGDYYIPFNAYKLITVDQCMLDDVDTAARAIDRCIKACVTHKQPVYIVVPADMVDEIIEFDCNPALDNALHWAPTPAPVSDPDALSEALDEILTRLSQAKRPLFVPGVELIRRNYRKYFAEITEKTQIPYVTMLLAKGILDEEHPNFIGLFQGARSRPEVLDLVKSSDCVIIIGEKLTDLNTGGFSTGLTDENRIIINYDNIKIRSHQYHSVYLPDLLQHLIDRLPNREAHPYPFKRARTGCVNRPSSELQVRPKDKLTMKSAFKMLSKYLEEDMVLIAETGASMFATAETLLPKGTTYIGQTFYGSIGYSVGACFGASIALKHEGKGRRCMLVVGDGSFQLTCQELSSMIRYGCSATVILINNDGYLIERVITDNTYNDIQMWKYAGLPAIFGGDEGARCETNEQWEAAFEAAKQAADKLHFIEGVFDKWDCNTLLKSAGRMMALNNDLEPSITEEMLAQASL